MNLIKEEEQMLRGERGEGNRTAMELLVAIGDAYDAEKMVPISRAHAASSGQEGDLYFVELLAKGGAKCRVQTSTNPVYDIEFFHRLFKIPQDEADVARRVVEGYEKLGAILSWSCVPYLGENIPLFGETVAFSESSATPYVNSVIGASTNREAAQSALAAGIIGKTPYYGLHIKENRKGTALFKVDADLKESFDYTLLGQYIGEELGIGIPVLTGIKKRPSTEDLINFCAMSNTSGAISMFYIPGFTVEAKTMKEAFQGDTPKDTVTITDQDLKQTWTKMQSARGKIDFVMLGCPHYTLRQLEQVADLLKGKKIQKGLAFWVSTTATARRLAERIGYVETIENAGGNVVVDTCIDEPCWTVYKDMVGMTDSPKCAYYRRFKDVIVSSMKDCVNAALKGEFE